MERTVIGIVGPTGSGKSSLALEFSRKWEHPVELVCLDSRQIYKDAVIGTASPSKEEREQAPHHLYNILSPNEVISAGRYMRLAKEKFEEIFERDAVPLLVGGTGFYLQALLEGLPDIPEPDEETRSRLLALERDWDSGRMHFLLMTVDPESANRINPRDRQRVIRALEVYYQMGRPLSSFERVREEDGIEYLIFGLMPIREILYESINRRVHRMLDEGFFEEVERLLGKYNMETPIFEGLGYREAIDYLSERISLEEMIEEMKKRTRNYAKRQLTWFRRVVGIWWLPLSMKGYESKEMDIQVKALIEGLDRWG